MFVCFSMAISVSPTHSESLDSHNMESASAELVCRPLKSLYDVEEFLREPPVWRSLCVELKRHSESVIRNMDIVQQNLYDVEIGPERPQNFCHFNPDLEDVARHRRADVPRTLVCHDMANGYHDDSKIDGTLNADAYTFYNWAVVDIFCYFSHHFVTIPPPGWINTGHKHGVKVIGTVITEWAEGTALWEEIFADPEGFAKSLVAIAKTLKFDGWLLNVENKVSNPEMLLQFVQYLHQLLHQELAAPVLIWYDSVTIDGHLHWQNGLNSRNKPFFDACDGIFTNYTWCEADVKTSKAEAGERARDVYIGIDVWGRNFLGGGHFNTQQAVKIVFEHGCSLAIFAPAWTHEAMADEDMKIIAPKKPYKIRLCRKFLLRDRALWGSLWPYLYTKLPSELPFQTSFCRGQGKKRWLYGEVLGPSEWFNLRHQQYQPNAAHGAHGYLLAPAAPPPPAPPPPPPPPALPARAASISSHKDSLQNITALPTVETAAPDFNTSDESLERKRTLLQRIRDIFRMRRRIEVNAIQSSHPVVHSARKSMDKVSMSLQLGAGRNTARYTLVHLPDELECIEVYYRDSFTGGSCVAINPCDETDIDHRFVRLFHCDFNIKGTLIVCTATKILPEDVGQYLNVILSVADERGSERRVTLVGRNLPNSSGGSADTCQPLDHSDPEFKELQRYLLVNEPGFYVATENAFGWKVRYYSLPLRGRVTSVNVRTGLRAGPVLLGHLGLCQR